MFSSNSCHLSTFQCLFQCLFEQGRESKSGQKRPWLKSRPDQPQVAHRWKCTRRDASGVAHWSVLQLSCAAHLSRAWPESVKTFGPPSSPGNPPTFIAQPWHCASCPSGWQLPCVAREHWRAPPSHTSDLPPCLVGLVGIVRINNSLFALADLTPGYRQLD